MQKSRSMFTLGLRQSKRSQRNRTRALSWHSQQQHRSRLVQSLLSRDTMSMLKRLINFSLQSNSKELMEVNWQCQESLVISKSYLQRRSLKFIATPCCKGLGRAGTLRLQIMQLLPKQRPRKQLRMVKRINGGFNNSSQLVHNRSSLLRRLDT